MSRSEKGSLLPTRSRPSDRILAAATGLAASLVISGAARAADPAMADLLEVLRKRGSISEEEYRSLSSSEASDSEVEAVPTLEAVEEKVAQQEERIEKAEKSIAENVGEILRIKEIADGTSSDLIGKALEGKWYERISIKGYTQFRIGEVLNQSGPQLEVPVDRSVRDNEVFTVRRGRFTFSGDFTERLFLYAQTDFNAFIGSGEAVLQMRDMYGDIALDAEKEWRLRFGLTKVPYGFVNLQSSQNRATLERADAINSAIEGERDYGAYLMWAPAEIRILFKDLVKRGLKGSGDYGVVALGAYNGQGSNRGDSNHLPHVVGRIAYPFALENGQIFELGAQYHWGRFVANTSDLDPTAAELIPSQPSNGAADQRAALSFVWYPQPFGAEAEWNVGEGPELTPDLSRVESRFLHGGYVQVLWKEDSSIGIWFPFVRWNYYTGGRKSGTNAPHSSVNEVDAGFEYSPFPEAKLTIMYTRSFERTNTRVAPYDLTKNADRIGVQVQWNY